MFAGSGEIEKVVDELEGETGIAAVVVEGFFVDFIEAAEDAAETGAAAKEASGFVSGEADGVGFGDIHAADFGELDEFTFDHFLGEVDEDIEDAEVSFFESDLEGTACTANRRRERCDDCPSGSWRRDGRGECRRCR